MKSDNINYYQSIPDLFIEGRQNTPQEFTKIGMPENLKGKSVLDIGCNIGAFLYEAIKRGSTYNVGIEPNLDWRIIAEGLFYENGLEDEVILLRALETHRSHYKTSGMKYDLVLLLSVLHVDGVDKPQEILDEAYRLTAPGGLLIVEINDRLQEIPVKLPGVPVLFGKNKDNRSVWHIRKAKK